MLKSGCTPYSSMLCLSRVCLQSLVICCAAQLYTSTRIAVLCVFITQHIHLLPVPWFHQFWLYSWHVLQLYIQGHNHLSAGFLLFQVEDIVNKWIVAQFHL